MRNQRERYGKLKPMMLRRLIFFKSHTSNVLGRGQAGPPACFIAPKSVPKISFLLSAPHCECQEPSPLRLVAAFLFNADTE